MEGAQRVNQRNQEMANLQNEQKGKHFKSVWANVLFLLFVFSHDVVVAADTPLVQVKLKANNTLQNTWPVCSLLFSY